MQTNIGGNFYGKYIFLHIIICPTEIITVWTLL